MKVGVRVAVAVTSWPLTSMRRLLGSMPLSFTVVKAAKILGRAALICWFVSGAVSLTTGGVVTMSIASGASATAVSPFFAKRTMSGASLKLVPTAIV